MSLTILQELYEHINRLYIAGSKFAAGDLRLQPFVTKLSTLGEKAPVFKKIANDVQELMQAESTQSPEKLLNLGNVLYAVLYTQGASRVSDAAVPLTPLFDLETTSTTLPHSIIAPVIEALTLSGSGRTEVLENALSQHVFQDIRVYEALDQALGDKNYYVTDYIRDHIVPTLNRTFLPVVTSSFMEDPKHRGVRLQVIHRIDAPAAEAFAEQVLREDAWGNDAKLYCAAIDIMATNPAFYELIDSFSQHKKADIREAAYHAMAKRNDEKATKILLDLWLASTPKNPAPSALIEALCNCQITPFSDSVLTEAHSAYAAMVQQHKEKAPEKTMETVIQTLYNAICVMGGLQDPRCLDLYSDILQHSESILKYKGYFIKDRIFKHICSSKEWGLDYSIALLQDPKLRKGLRRTYVEHLFSFIAEHVEPTTLYDLFHQDYIHNAYHIRQSLLERAPAIDPRWFEIIIEVYKKDKKKDGYNDMSTIHFLEDLLKLIPPDHPLFTTLLTEELMEIQGKGIHVYSHLEITKAIARLPNPQPLWDVWQKELAYGVQMLSDVVLHDQKLAHMELLDWVINCIDDFYKALCEPHLKEERFITDPLPSFFRDIFHSLFNILQNLHTEDYTGKSFANSRVYYMLKRNDLMASLQQILTAFPTT